MNKKILFIISDLEYGGAQKVLVNIANYFSKNNTVEILTIYKYREGKFSLKKSIKRSKLNVVSSKLGIFNKLINNIRVIIKIRRLIKKSNCEIIISFLSTTNILSILSNIGFKKKLVISERNDPKRQKLTVYWKILRFCFYRFANLITANSQNALKGLSHLVEEKKLVYLPNPIQIDRIKSLKKKEKIILAVGRLVHQKGFDLLIDAFKKSNLHKTNWKLVIIGKGELKNKLYELVKEFQIEDSVCFPGFIENIKPWFLKSSFFVLSSRFEGMPNVVLESISYKLPLLISAECEFTTDFLKKDQSFVMVDINNTNEFSEKLKKLAFDKSLKEKIASNALNSLNNNFSSQSIQAIWRKLLK